MLSAAQTYWNKGKSIIPVGKDKRPKILWQDYQKKQCTYPQVMLWFDRDYDPEVQIALPTGAFNGFVVIDCDSEEANESFLEKFPEARETRAVKTPRGYHYYFKYREGVRNDAGKKLGTGIDIRGDGGYVLAPPSVLAPGASYRWFNNHPIREMGESLAQALLPTGQSDDLEQRSNQRANLGSGGAGKFPSGTRNQQLTKIAGSQRRYGVQGEALFEVLWKVNIEQCDPPLTEKEVRTIAKSVERYEPEDVAKAPDDTDTLIEVPIHQVKTEQVNWLWHHRIPLGRITLIEGDPGVCKSWLTLAIASAVTTGESLPGGPQFAVPSGSVILFSAEDTLSDTVRPRLEGQGADLSRVIAIQGILDANGERGISLRDLGYIEKVIKKHKASMVIIDPVVAYVGGIDANRAQDVRSVLAPLSKVAERNQTAIVLVRHLNKTITQASNYRGQGSIDWLGACRSAFQVIPDPNDRDIRYVVHCKNSLAKITPTLMFSVKNNRVEFTGENWMTADELWKLKKKKGSDEGSEDTEDRDGQGGRADIFG